MKTIVIGAGLAGCEAAWQLAKQGINTVLMEMRPRVMTPAHHTGNLAELVCSNSLKAERIENAAGLLKEEMRLMDSLVIQAADASRVPAGGALAVDRDLFSKYISERLESHPLLDIVREEATVIPDKDPVIIATGPLSSESISREIERLTGSEYLYFYDAAAPVVAHESIDMSKVFKASRYNRGDDDYINCPMNREEYLNFYHNLINAERAELKTFEGQKVFEGCMPIEIMASRGEDTIRFGPLKPVGLIDPRTGREPYAVVQLRQDDRRASLYNMVGFQTNLRFGEQKRVFSLIPGLENAEFVRYGVMHRNTFIDSPRLLDCFYRFRKEPRIMFAGQITGVEGYIESASSGLAAGYNLGRTLNGKEPVDFTDETAIGALAHYVSDNRIKDFQPMSINFGIMAPLGTRIRNKQEKNRALANRALEKVRYINGR